MSIAYEILIFQEPDADLPTLLIIIKLILHKRTLKTNNVEPLGKMGVTFPCLCDH